MKIFYVKKRNKVTCFRCTTVLDTGEVYIRTGYKNSQLGWFFFLYHPDCLIDTYREKVTKLVANFILENPPPAKRKTKDLSPKKRGRPRLYSNTEEARKLSCLLAYHRKKQHGEEVVRLKDKLAELRR